MTNTIIKGRQAEPPRHPTWVDQSPPPGEGRFWVGFATLYGEYSVVIELMDQGQDTLGHPTHGLSFCCWLANPDPDDQFGHPSEAFILSHRPGCYDDPAIVEAELCELEALLLQVQL